jgi:hypothetical protein
MIYNNKQNYKKIHHIVQNKVNKEIVMIIIKIEIELIMMNNKNVSVLKIYLVHNGFNVVINKNVEVLIGIIYNVQGWNKKI